MKNLNVVKRKHIGFKSDVVAYCIDDDGTLYVLKKNFNILKTQIYCESVEIKSETCGESVSIVSIIGSEEITHDKLRLFEVLVEIRSLLIALEDGYLILVPISCLGDKKCIYKHERKISSITLTSSQDNVLLADEDNNIQLISLFDGTILHSSNALSQNESLFKPVGVGWGSKESQFFGLDGRLSKEKQEQAEVIRITEDELAASQEIQSSDSFISFRKQHEKSTIICENSLIATLTYLPDSSKHIIKVWNANLELQYMSEQLVTVERGLFCYIPDGKFICLAQRRDDRINEITLFEKNGLVRQRISLPTFLPDLYISSMAWSHSAHRILAVITKRFVIRDGQVQQQNVLMLYTMQNWHYYLKSSIRLSDNCDYIMKWDFTTQNRLHLMSTTGGYILYDCNFHITYSWDRSSVAVVDSNKLLITPLELCVIPPPMAAITLEMNSLIYRIAYDCKSVSRVLILTLDDKLVVTNPAICPSLTKEDDNEFKVYASQSSSNEILEKMIADLNRYVTFSLSQSNSYQNLTPLQGKFLGAASRDRENDGVSYAEIVLFQVDSNSCDLVQTVAEPESPANFRHRHVNHICPDASYDYLMIVLDDTSVYSLSLSNYDGKLRRVDLQLTPQESRFNYCIRELQTNRSADAKPYVISLSHDRILRFNAQVISSGSCTSFINSGSYLIYTTDSHMHFILTENLEANQSDHESWSQPIESNGTIIFASTVTPKVILQMPRGNLETISPRILVLQKIIDLMKHDNNIDACKYAKRHRVNMNFLIDYLLRTMNDPKDINTFAKTIASHDPNLLCLVLTELDNEDTIADRYSEIIKHIPDNKSINRDRLFPDKVNFVVKHIDLPQERRFLNPRLQCLLKMEPKRIGDALKIVHQLDSSSRSAAIKFLLYFIDIDQLFDESLSTYDTDITLMVASSSNKDPKQYLALLDELNGIQDENLRRYKIDLYVRKYELALKHLFAYGLCNQSDTGVKEEIYDLISSKRIYKSALSLVSAFDKPGVDINDMKGEIWARYGNYLMEKRHFHEAGTAFSKASSLKPSCMDRALACLSLVDDWERSLVVIVRQTDLMMYKTLERFSAQLMERGKCTEALLVLHHSALCRERLQATKSVDELIQRRSWYLAESIASSFYSTVAEIPKLEISNSVLDAYNSQMEIWTSEFSTAKNQFARLKLLLTTCKINPARGRLENGDFISDSLSTVDGSEMSSIVSGSDNQKVARSGVTSIKTRVSTKSSKTKEKRIKLQEGSRHEDRALVLELKKFMAKQAANQSEAVRLAAALYEYCSYDNAVATTDNMNKFLTGCLTFSQTTSELLWPQAAQLEQMYSLYTKMALPSGDEAIHGIDNVDLEVLMKPNLPSNLRLFEM